jgi:hypothetical protein
MIYKFNVQVVYGDEHVFLSHNEEFVFLRVVKSCFYKWCSFVKVSEEGKLVFSNHLQLISKYSEDIKLNKISDRKKIPKEIKTMIKKLDKENQKEQRRNLAELNKQKKRKREEYIIDDSEIDKIISILCNLEDKEDKEFIDDEEIFSILCSHEEEDRRENNSSTLNEIQIIESFLNPVNVNMDMDTDINSAIFDGDN